MIANNKPISIGIDIGSRFTKIVFWDYEKCQVVSSGVAESGIDPIKTVKELRVEAYEGDASSFAVCSTGYGRKLLETKYVSEISCHAKAIAHLIPDASTVVDIGGQDSKVIILGDSGKVVDFVMNDKCAAGTGSFFESIARLCNFTVSEIAEMALKSQKELNMSSTCVVFAESEIISMINNQERIEDILMAVHKTVAHRVKSMLPVQFLSSEKKFVLTGGVAKNKAMVQTLEREIAKKITVPPNPSITGAMGAAIYAGWDRQKKRAEHKSYSL